MSNALAFPEAVASSLSADTALWNAARMQARGAVLRSDADVEAMGNVVRFAREAHKRIDGERTKITRPLLDAKAAADRHFADVLRACEEIQKIGRAKISEYVEGRKAETFDAMARSADLAAAGVVPTEIIPAPVDTKAAGVSVREEWAFEVIDPTLVERGLCSPDPAKIAHVLSAYGPGDKPHVIPGVRVYLQSRTVVR